MKVLDLQCGQGHLFEGWFGSEDDFQSQSLRALVLCPLCGDSSVVKKLSAPRLNLTTYRSDAPSVTEGATPEPSFDRKAFDAAWLAVARTIVANTKDVGADFAHQARKIHYGEVENRPIRGQATPSEARELIEEGIAVIPVMLPDSVKGTLQ